MFRDRIFNLSLIFSIAWHLFWISLIGIAMMPSGQTSDIHQEIDFLGPILEKTAFDLMVEGVKPQAETLYASSTLFMDRLYLKPEGPVRRVRKEFMSEALPDRFVFSLQDYLEDKREVPLYFTQELAAMRRSEEGKKMPLVEGPASERGIIFKPGFPAVPRGLYGDSEEYIVKLKFSVSRNGLVCDVEPIVSSGFPEVDLEATKFLKRWRFSPSGTAAQAKSWGIVMVRVEAK